MTLFYGEKLRDVFCLADFRLFGAKKDNSLPLASLFTLFSESKKRQKIFAAQTPPRKRGYGRILPTATKYASENSKILILHYPQNCVAKSPRDRRADMGFCTKSNQFGASVIFYIVTQSTGHTFSTSLPTAR